MEYHLPLIVFFFNISPFLIVIYTFLAWTLSSYLIKTTYMLLSFVDIYIYYINLDYNK